MIQRIQTIYLLLAAALMSSLFLPVFEFAALKPNVPSTQQGVFTDGVFHSLDSTLLVILIAGVAAISLIDIFLFKNRKLQILLARLSIILTLSTIIIAGYIFYQDPSNLANEMNNVQVRLGLFVPIVSMLLLFFSITNIKKDEKIVRSMDRLR